MKSIADYFQREKKSDSPRQKLESGKNSFDEDEPSSDVWVLYSSGDEAEGCNNESTPKKARLLVQLPQPIMDLDLVHCNKKRKRSSNNVCISKDFSIEEKKMLNISVHSSIEKDECSFYMSPLRLESATSGVATPCSANSKISATLIATSSPDIKGTPSRRVSRRSLFSSNCESQKQDHVKEERDNSNGDLGSICNIGNISEKNNYSDEVNEKGSLRNGLLLIEKSNDIFQPVEEVIQSAGFNITYTSPKNVFKEKSDNLPNERKKKKTTSDENLETFDDSPRKAKRRKGDTQKNVLDNSLVETQNNLLNYFSKKGISNATETSPKIVKEVIFLEGEFESLQVDLSPKHEQVSERSDSPVNSRKVSRRKSETHLRKKLIKEEKKEEEDVSDSSSRKRVTSISGGDGSSSDLSERRSSLRLRHRMDIKQVNSSEDEISPIIHRDRRAQKNFGKKSAAKNEDNEKVKSKGVKIQSNDGKEIVILTDTNSVGSSKKVIIKQAYVKLAPLFLAKEELRRKQVFLQSGTPEVLKKKLLQQKQVEAEFEGRNEFPVISHILQCDHGLFPWNLGSKRSLSQIPEREALPLAQQEVEILTTKDKFHLGIVTDIPTLMANSLVSMRPPSLVEVELDFDFNFSSDKLDEWMPCFCSSQSLNDANASEVTPVDVEKFLRVNSWIMRSIMPPGVAYKMNVDLSSFLPSPSPSGFIHDHISVLPTDQSCADIRRNMLLKLKEDYPGLAINRWFKNFYQKRRNYGGLCMYENREVEDSERHGQQRGDVSSAKGYCQVGAEKKPWQEKLTTESWADIFSPRCFEDACILGKNLDSLKKLKDWLQKWKDRGSKVEKKAQRYYTDDDYSSGSEFCSSDDENEDSRKSGKLPNVAVLIGQCGSGKTSGVYAIANELGLKVLEINASSKRSGKNVLDAVKEATRSHQVTGSPLHSFLRNKGGKKVAKKPKNLKENVGETSGMSVIFVEDVDVVFDDRDDGFIAALASLTATSKRPFILEVHTSDPLKMGSTNNLLLQEDLIRSSPHLNTLLAKQSKTPIILPFQLSSKNLNAEALLRVICLSEGVWVSKHWCECIFSKSSGDFRHALLQAHFWAGSIARARILHEGKTRYSDDVLQGIKPARNMDFYQDNKIVANPCGCKKTYSCSYPYSWMFKDYIKQLWLNLDGIVAQGKVNTMIKGHSNYQDPSNSVPLLKCESTFNNSKTNSPLLASNHQHKMVVSSMEIETNLRNGNICLAEGEEFSAQNLSNETKLIMSCSPKAKAGKGSRGKKKTSARRRLLISDTDVKLNDQENNGCDEIPKIKETCKLQSHAAMKSHFEVLDFLSTCDVLLSKFEEREGNDLGKDMVFQMGTLSTAIDLFMQVTPSESCREMKAKMQKTACTASQLQLILPLLPSNWFISNKMLAHDVVPHIREICRIQNDLAAMGRGRTRHSSRHPTLRQFGPSLRDALCNTLVDHITIISEDNCV